MQRESSEAKRKLTFEDYLPHEPESIVVTLIIILMALYYIWRMINLTPWYDELYTYYTFISKGPIYSAIHWPLPNNHVGYSVLSAFLDLFGNSYIGLRGVSYICAVSNLILIYRICKRYISHYVPVAIILLYASMQLVNELSVQGRGYTLATTCFLLGIYELDKLCTREKMYISDYVKFSAIIILGLYTIPSSFYWVVPMCLSGGIYLFFKAAVTHKTSENFWKNTYFIRLKKLLFTSFGAAMATLVLYTVIWLAIGSNLLLNEDPTLSGMGHVSIIMNEPARAAFRGIKYMLDQPYIQSVDREGYLLKLLSFLISLGNYYYYGFGIVLLVVVIAALIIMVSETVHHFNYHRTCFNIIIATNLIMIPVLLIITCKIPYYRIFSYAGVLVAISIGIIFEHIINNSVRLYNARTARILGERAQAGIYTETTKYRKTKDVWYDGIGMYIPFVTALIFAICHLTSSTYYAQLGSREHQISEAYCMVDPTNYDNVCVLDCDQQYLLKFEYDIDCENMNIIGADYVLIDRNMMDAEYNGSDFWKFYQTYDSIDWDYIENNLTKTYENEGFVLYVLK